MTFVTDLTGLQNLSLVTSLKLLPTTVTTEQPNMPQLTTSSPPCGKICSYEWDSKEEGIHYPLLHKVVICSDIFYRMAHSPYPVLLPPPRNPPADLLQNFTINGQCPISRFRYIDESIDSKKPASKRFNAKQFRKLMQLDNVTNINHYKDKHVLKPAFVRYKHVIDGKRVAVVGTLTPWAEAMLVNLGARSVTTIEYTKLVIEHERVSTITPYRIAEQFVKGQATLFDTVFSYSSLEHSGLGRYGDPITPFGDLEASAQVWCMVKPGGHFILAVPASVDRVECSIVWNAHRVYGVARLQHLTANWRVLEELEAMDFHKHRIFVLEKIQLTNL